VVAEIRKSIVRPYRDFIAWGSLYEVANDEEQERRMEQVSRSLDDLYNRYLPRSMWLEPGTRKKIEAFAEKAETLLVELSESVEKRTYARARSDIARRVTRELGPLRKEVEAGLEAELSGPEPGRWRDRLRRNAGR
jgi:hypothetical protein